MAEEAAEEAKEESAEEAPADAFFIPTNAKNKRDAKKWLAFVARPDVQSEWNETIGQLPINSKAKVADISDGKKL